MCRCWLLISHFANTHIHLHTFHTDASHPHNHIAPVLPAVLPRTPSTTPAPFPAFLQIGLGVVDGDQTIVRMDGSNGRFFVTNDPNCGNSITSSAYPTSFSNLYVCGQCKGGCPQVDGGEEPMQCSFVALPSAT
jgi:hypothetical protein